MTDQFERVSKLAKNQVVSEDELKRKEFLMRTVQARVTKTKADLNAAEQLLRQTQVELEVLRVCASRDGASDHRLRDD